ncbi:MAG TPA: zf-HC2 domain-containing protein [Pseudobacteroides sp.]|nr:zf-HC2 domain-containing protein [Pseudobacteroides sp.]
MKKCEDIRELISEYIDGDMSGDLLSEFEEHISSCEDCRNELNDVKSIIAMLNDTPDEDLPLNFKDELHERLLEEKAKKKNVISLVIAKYSHVFASAAGLLIIFTIWMVYNNNIGLKEGSPNVNSIQSYESNEYSTNEFSKDGSLDFGNSEFQSNMKTFLNNDKSQADVGIQQAQGQDAVDITGNIDKDASKYQVTLGTSNPNMKNGSQEIEQAKDKVAIIASGDANTEKQDTTNSSDDINISFPTASIAAVPDEKLYKSADFTVNAKDTSSGINSIRSIVLALGGEEIGVNAKFLEPKDRGTESGDGVSSKMPESISPEADSRELFSFKIPANEYDLFCQKANEIFGPSNVIINGVIVSEYESRKKEIQAEFYEIDKKIESKAKDSKWSSSSEYKDLINKKNSLTKELDEIEAQSQYMTVTIKVQKLK